MSDVNTALDQLASVMEGDLVRPGDVSYNEARSVFNGMIDRRPAAVARCVSNADVQAAVLAARDLGLELAVRGGGHNVAGFATVDDGLVIDLEPMNRVTVDPSTRRVCAGGGATLGDLDSATQTHGLVVPAGVVSDTGVAGLTLTGGIGWLRRKHGLTCDNLVGANVVTADGNVVEVTGESHPELLWGLRGGGGNFGVVTELVFQAHPLGPEVAFVTTFYLLEIAGRVLTEHERIVEEAGRDVSSLVMLGHIPATQEFPEEIHEAPYVGVYAMYAGPADAGVEVLRPLTELGEPMLDHSGVMPFVDVQRVYDADYPTGRRYYWKSTNVETVTTEVAELLVGQIETAPSKDSTIDIWLNGGAIVETDSAFGGKDDRYLITAEASWDSGDDDANIAWSRGVLDVLDPYATDGLYLNFPGLLEEGDDLVRASHGPNYPRLQALKREFDPNNLFHRNANIKPG